MIYKFETGKVFGSTSKHFEEGKKVVIHMGGTGSGKTYEIMMFLVFQVLMKKPNQIITVVSESYPHLEIGVIRYLIQITQKVGIYSADTWNKSRSVFLYPPTGSLIEFFSADRISKALGARRDWLYGNEVNSLKMDIWEELARRSENIIADFNPTSQFWLEEWLLNYDDTVIVKSNYLDNVFLSDTEKQRIIKRSQRDPNFKRVHINCEYGIFEGLVFEKWSQIDSMPEGEGVYGLDWGFSNDPSAIVKVIEQGDNIFVDEVLYRTGMVNREIIKFMESINIKKNYDMIIADSAEPKSIQDVHLAGFNVIPAKKGPDSIRSGIDYIKSKNLFITKRSTNLIRELRNYSWELDKNGKATNKPVDNYNHAIDALRYAVSPKHKFKQSIA